MKFFLTGFLVLGMMLAVSLPGQERGQYLKTEKVLSLPGEVVLASYIQQDVQAGNLYVQDTAANAVWLLDAKTGAVKARAGRKGEGPGEFRSLRGMALDVPRKRVWAWEGGSGRRALLRAYRLDTLEAIGEWRVGDRLERVWPLEEGLLLQMRVGASKEVLQLWSEQLQKKKGWELHRTGLRKGLDLNDPMTLMLAGVASNPVAAWGRGRLWASYACVPQELTLFSWSLQAGWADALVLHLPRATRFPSLFVGGGKGRADIENAFKEKGTFYGVRCLHQHPGKAWGLVQLSFATMAEPKGGMVPDDRDKVHYTGVFDEKGQWQLLEEYPPEHELPFFVCQWLPDGLLLALGEGEEGQEVRWLRLEERPAS